MANRPVFIPDPAGPTAVRTLHVDFPWSAGLSLAQQQKSIAALHQAACHQPGVTRVLDVSRKSPEPLGVALSAFNLSLPEPSLARAISVEAAFQGGKMFEQGGPFLDILALGPREAKQDPRLQSSGRLIGFQRHGRDWPLEPVTAFYDALYLSALHARQDLVRGLADYSAFTDIAFNPAKSVNCQAYSVALYLSLRASGLLEQALSSPAAFLSILRQRASAPVRREDRHQPSLF